jgi:hypothetical protein
MASAARPAWLLMTLTVVGCHVAKDSGAPPDPSGCLSATVAHEEHTDAADGVAHEVRYSERFYRCGDHVWTERVLPAGPASNELHRGHRELPPMHRLGKLVTRSAEGDTVLALVARDDREIITMSPSSHDLAELHGDFASASHLLAPAALASMSESKVKGRQPADGAHWLERTGAGGYVRVLWSTTYDFPLEIESGSSDGHKRDHITVTMTAKPEQYPWEQLDGYAKVTDADFMD